MMFSRMYEFIVNYIVGPMFDFGQFDIIVTGSSNNDYYEFSFEVLLVHVTSVVIYFFFLRFLYRFFKKYILRRKDVSLW